MSLLLALDYTLQLIREGEKQSDALNTAALCYRVDKDKLRNLLPVRPKQNIISEATPDETPNEENTRAAA